MTPPGARPLLSLTGVSHRFGGVEAVADVSFSVAHGEFVALVGPSGCGKSTLLNLCSGWLQPTAGRVDRPERLRMVFQQDGLFPWMTVGENIDLGLRHLSDAADRRSRRETLLDLVRLDTFASHYPHQLSGGMRQRAELARALGGDTDLRRHSSPTACSYCPIVPHACATRCGSRPRVRATRRSPTWWVRCIAS